jgi:hypothetical protein
VDDDELAAEGLRQRVASEDALGQLAKELLENPLVTRLMAAMIWWRPPVVGPLVEPRVALTPQPLR